MADNNPTQQQYGRNHRANPRIPMALTMLMLMFMTMFLILINNVTGSTHIN